MYGAKLNSADFMVCLVETKHYRDSVDQSNQSCPDDACRTSEPPHIRPEPGEMLVLIDNVPANEVTYQPGVTRMWLLAEDI